MCVPLFFVYMFAGIYIYIYMYSIYIYIHTELVVHYFSICLRLPMRWFLIFCWAEKKDVYICDTMLYAFSGSFERIEMQGTAKPCPAIASPARGHSTGNPLTSSHVAWQQDFGRIWTAAGPNQSPQCFTERAIDSNHVLTKLCLFNHCLRVAGKHQPATQGGTGWRTEPRTSQL